MEIGSSTLTLKRNFKHNYNSCYRHLADHRGNPKNTTSTIYLAGKLTITMDIITAISTIVTKCSSDLLTGSIKHLWASKNNLEVKLGDHLREVVSWTGRVQFFGMASSKQLEDSTIMLSICTEPRKFRSRKNSTISANNNNSGLSSEIEILDDPNHNILLGDPGSGKTTTIKRIARRLLFEEAETSNDIYQFPLVIRLVELDKPLFFYLAEILGLSGQIRLGPEYKSPKDGRIKRDYFIGDMPIENVIYNCLNNFKALVLFDGLDEVDPDFRNKENLDNDIENLARNLIESKIIISCRSGDLNLNWSNFDILELVPLSENEIKIIAKKWVLNCDDFLESLKKLPYRDIVDRPLFLTQLLFIYSKEQCLPEQPSHVYKKMINLMLEAWDQERRIVRKSKYADFNPTRKLDFLSAISYQLTYKTQKKIFSSIDLVNSYSSVCDSYGLPQAEASQVASEIETHTGLIVAFQNSYEFSHLSLQEYLCANYIVRSPYAEKMESYLRHYPAPIAVCIALASDPGEWLSSIILNNKYFLALDSGRLNSFLKRLINEKPYFAVSNLLGFSFIKLSLNQVSYNLRDTDDLERLLYMRNVRESIFIALDYYSINQILSKNDKHTYYIQLKNKYYRTELGADISKGGFIERGFFATLLGCDNQKLYKSLSMNSNQTVELNPDEYQHILNKKDI